MKGLLFRQRHLFHGLTTLAGSYLHDELKQYLHDELKSLGQEMPALSFKPFHFTDQASRGEIEQVLSGWLKGIPELDNAQCFLWNSSRSGNTLEGILSGGLVSGEQLSVIK